MKRRHFIQTLAAAPLLAAETQRKAPFRTLYSNDLTNITSCVSPSQGWWMRIFFNRV